MKLTKRSAIAVAGLGSLAAAAVIAVPSGSAQVPGATTIAFYEPDAGSIFRITDNPPKSPSKNPESPKYRFSFGDNLTISAPLFDRKGGTRQGRLYAQGSVVKGKTFRDVSLHVNGTYVLNDGSQIAVQGVLSFASDVTFSVVGGTGKYEGARGHVTSHEDDDSSTDTLTLLP